MSCSALHQIHLFILIVCASTCAAQQLPIEPTPSSERRQELGKLPLLQYFPHQFESRPQVTCIIQVPNGLIYATTSAAIIEFDGIRWRRIEAPGEPLSVGADESGNVFVGCREDFGVLQPDRFGRLRYQSFKDRVPDGTEIGLIVTVATNQSEVIFRSFRHVFRLDSHTGVVTKHAAIEGSEISCLRRVNGRFVAGVKGNRATLMEFVVGSESVVEPGPVAGSGEANQASTIPHTTTQSNSALKPLAGSEKITGTIVGIAPADGNGLLVATRRNGFYLYGNGTSERIAGQASAYAKRNQVRCLHRISEELFAMGTLYGGLAVFDRRGNLTRILARNNDLTSQRVNKMAKDTTQRGWWLATGNGIVRVDLLSSIQYFDRDLGLSDASQGMAYLNDRLYVGTASGLFVLKHDRHPGELSRFKVIQNSRSYRRPLLTIDDRILAADSGGSGLVEIHESDEIKSRETPSEILQLVPSLDSQFVYAPTLKRGVLLLRKLGNDWGSVGQIANTPPERARAIGVVEVPGRRLWVSIRTKRERHYIQRVDWKEASVNQPTNRQGEIPPHPLSSPDQVSISEYGEDKGLPENDAHRLFVWKEKLFVGCRAGLFQYDPQNDRFVSSGLLGKTGTTYSRQFSYVAPQVDAQQRLWLCNHDNELASFARDDDKPQIAWSMLTLGGKTFRGLFAGRDQAIWAKTNDGSLIRFDPSLEPDADELQAPLIRQIETTNGDLRASNRDSQTSSPKSTLRITCALVRHVAPSRHRYQYRLVGLNEDWSDWSDQSYYEFAGLREGQYRFDVRGRDEQMRVSPIATYDFRVLPPWHRSWLAYVCYAVCSASLFLTLLWLRSRSQQRQVIRLENSVNARTAQLQKARDELEQKVHERTADIAELQREVSLRSRVSELGEMTASIAHELNQPLTAIGANVGAARVMFTQGTEQDGEFLEILADIASDNRRAADIIASVRALTKNESIEFASVDLKSVIERIAVLLSAEAGHRKATIELELPNHLPPVRGNVTQLQQVIVNLVTNGFDAMVDAGCDRRIVIRCNPLDDDWVCVSVCDFGCGFQPDQVDKLFAPFQTTKPTGVGLGLAICRRIIEAHGAKIWAENNQNAGATVSFTLPIDHREHDC